MSSSHGGTASTDSFGFNGMKLFEVARDCLPDDRKRTQNLVETKDDMLFVWNSKNCCVLTLNWRAANVKKEEQQKYQVGAMETSDGPRRKNNLLGWITT